MLTGTKWLRKKSTKSGLNMLHLMAHYLCRGAYLVATPMHNIIFLNLSVVRYRFIRTMLLCFKVEIELTFANNEVKKLFWSLDFIIKYAFVILFVIHLLLIPVLHSWHHNRLACFVLTNGVWTFHLFCSRSSSANGTSFRRATVKEEYTYTLVMALSIYNAKPNAYMLLQCSIMTWASSE